MIKMFAIPTFKAFAKKIGLNAHQISILLISISIVIWSFSMLFSKMYIGSYGLINGINPLFFISMSLLIFSFFITIKENIEDNFLLVLHLSLIIIFYASITVLIEGIPRFPYNFETSKSVDYILQYGHSNSELIHYQSWPGVFYFGAIETLLTSISPLNSILIIPLIFIIPNTLVGYLLFSTFLSKKETWTALLLSNALIFSAPIYLLPGSISGMMTGYALLLFFRFEVFNNRATIGSRTIFIIFCSAAVVSHFLTNVYLVFVLFFMSGLLYISKHKTDRKFILVFVLIAAFQVYVAGSYALDQVTGSVHTAFDLEKTANDVKGMAFGGSEEHQNVVNIRIISMLILLILAAVGFFYEILIKKRMTLKNLSLPVWFSANASLTLITSYSGEIISRTFAQSIGILQMLSAKLINDRKLSIFLLLILVISPPLSIVNAYGNEAIDYVSPAEINGANFLFDHTPNSSIVISFQPRTWGIKFNEKLGNWVTLGDLTNEGDLHQNLEKTNIQYNKMYSNFFVLVSVRDIKNYEFGLGEINSNNLRILETGNISNRIYDNHEFILYRTGV